MTSQLSLEHLKEEAAKLLDQIPNGELLGTRLYNAVARLKPSIALEAVALRERNGRIEVFMTLRRLDEVYSGQWHVPGSILRNREQPKDVFARLATLEFHVPIKSFTHVYTWYFQEDRGWLEDHIFVVDLEGTPPDQIGQWFLVDQLPHETISFHGDTIIPKAVEAYRDGRVF